MAEADAVQTDIMPPVITPDPSTPAAPIEIDLDAGIVVDQTPPPADGQQKPNGADGAQPEPQKRVPRTQARIQALSSEKSRLEAELAAERAEAEKLRRERDEATAGREQAERSGMENYGARVKSDKESAKTELAAAIASNDATALIAAQEKLAKAAAAEQDYDTWAEAHKKPEPGQQQRQPQPPPQQRQQQQPQVQVSEPVRNFMLDNPWFNPYQVDDSGQLVLNNGRPVENPDFDPEMRDAALLRDAQIKREIRQGRKPQTFLESEDYFNDILGVVANTFPDAFDDAPPPPPPPPQQRPRAPQMQAPRQPVAPAQRQAMPGQQPQKPGNRIQLSGEERSFVDALVSEGTMRYPRNHPDADKRGKVMTPQDAYITYARNKQQQAG